MEFIIPSIKNFKELKRGLDLEIKGGLIFIHILSNSDLCYPMFTIKMTIDEFMTFYYTVDDFYENVYQEWKKNG